MDGQIAGREMRYREVYVEVAVGVERVKLRGHQRLLGLGGWTDRKLDGGGRYGEVEVQGWGTRLRRHWLRESMPFGQRWTGWLDK